MDLIFKKNYQLYKDMKKREAKSNTTLNHYLQEKKFYCYYELKEPRGNTFNFANIEINQDSGLPALAKNGLTIKWSDEDSRKKACDGMCTPPLPAYLVIKFGRKLYFINYTVIQNLKEDKIKSIDEKTCQYWATKVVHI